MRKTLLLLISLIAYVGHVSAQQPNPEGGLVKWMSLEEAMKLNEKVQKPILLDFYTDWCGWCKQMMKTTYSEPGLAQYVNNYFYPVKFNAEGKDTIEYLGIKYKPTSDGPRAPHEFAVKMLNGSMSYPTTLFINGYDTEKKEFQLNMMAAGYLDAQKIEPMLVFTVENVFRNSSFDEFNTHFEKSFRDSTLDEQLKKLKWLSPKEAFDNSVKTKKKSIVLINTTWCNSCKVMQRTSFIDKEVFGYADSTYRFIDFNPEYKDSINFKGQTFINPGHQSPFHQLAIAFCKNNLVLPTMALLDEENNLLDAIPFYLPPTILKKILVYYGSDIYKTKSWKEYSGIGK